MKSAEAKIFVDNLYKDVYAHWDKKINHGAFMTQLRAGTLPLPCLRRFFKDWSLFSIEVVALNAVSYYVHLPFFVENYDLLPAFSDKIAEELISPKPPGHILILLETANGLGSRPGNQRLLPAGLSGRFDHRVMGRSRLRRNPRPLVSAVGYCPGLPLRYDQAPGNLFHRPRRSRPGGARR